ncbi:MAG: hemolysin family protein [Treponema sp.]|nr:hemolysin family protein [Treponema sp.]
MDVPDATTTNSSFWPLVILLVILITLSCIFSISESSLLGINRLKLRLLRNKNDKRAVRTSKLLENKEQLINTLLVSNDLVNILISSLITAVSLKLFGEKGVGIATVVATVLLLIFGEITPKTISTRCPDQIAYALSGFINVLFYIMRPVIIVITFFARCILRLFGIKPEKKKQTYSEDEIKTYFDIGTESGALEENESSMMNRVLKFTDLEAQDIMIPRTKITSVSLDATYRDVVELSGRTSFSRFPVTRKSIDDIVGILYLKDLLKYKNKPEEFSVSRVMRQPIFIPGTKNMSSVQALLIENRQTMAIVVDEYSGTDGLVASEDISREIFSRPEEKTLRGKVFNYANIEDQNDFEINGSVLIMDLQNALNIPFESHINETIGGWFTEQIDRMPEVEDFIDYREYRFSVKKIQARRIERIRIQKLTNNLDESETEGEDEE